MSVILAKQEDCSKDSHVILTTHRKGSHTHPNRVSGKNRQYNAFDVGSNIHLRVGGPGVEPEPREQSAGSPPCINLKGTKKRAKKEISADSEKAYMESSRVRAIGNYY